MMNDHCAMIDKVTGREVALRAVAVRGLVNGLSVNWQVTQQFANREKMPIEAVFTFPLPADATLCSLKILTGDKTIVTHVEEREKAFEDYDAAISSGDGAYLLDRERADLFVMNLGNILPGQSIEVQIEMFQLLHGAANGARVAFPVAVVPKYFPAASTTEITEWERITPDFVAKVPYGFSLAVKIVQSCRISLVESPSHPIRVVYGDNEADITLSQANTVPDTDVVISFELAEHIKPRVSRCNFLGREHLLFEVFPEFTADAGDSSRRKELAFVVDCSGSMEGDAIREAVNALQLCVRSLNEGDLFQIICFGSSYEVLFDHPRVLDDTTLAEASAKIARITAKMGGTEILPALKAAVASLSVEFADIVLFTDGAVGNEKAVFDFVAANQGRCRFFPFGIGNGVSESLIRGIAERGRGQPEFVFPGERIEAKVLRQFNRMASPFLSNVSIDWGCKGVEAVPALIPAVFSGEVFRVAARIKEGKALPADLNVELHAQLGDRQLVFNAEAVISAANSVPARWWAQQRINDLEAGAAEVAAGSRQKRGPDRTKQTIIELAKAYGIICSLTSMIGFEERSDQQKNNGQVELRRVPVMLPAGRDFMASQPLGAKSSGFGSILNCMSACYAPASLIAREESQGLFSSTVSRLRNAFAQPDPAPAAKEARGTAIPLGSDKCEDKLIEILMHAGADGLFKKSDELLALIGVNEPEFAAWLSKAPASLKAPERQKYAMTILVKDYLERHFADRKDLWAAIVVKGEKRTQKMH